MKSSNVQKSTFQALMCKEAAYDVDFDKVLVTWRVHETIKKNLGRSSAREQIRRWYLSLTFLPTHSQVFPDWITGATGGRNGVSFRNDFLKSHTPKHLRNKTENKGKHGYYIYQFLHSSLGRTFCFFIACLCSESLFSMCVCMSCVTNNFLVVVGHKSTVQKHKRHYLQRHHLTSHINSLI